VYLSGEAMFTWQVELERVQKVTVLSGNKDVNYIKERNMSREWPYNLYLIIYKVDF